MSDLSVLSTVPCYIVTDPLPTPYVCFQCAPSQGFQGAPSQGFQGGPSGWQSHGALFPAASGVRFDWVMQPVVQLFDSSSILFPCAYIQAAQSSFVPQSTRSEAPGCEAEVRIHFMLLGTLLLSGLVILERWLTIPSI